MSIDHLISLAVDIVAIFLLAYVLYFRRHRRTDLLLGYVGLNVGIFSTMSVLTSVRLDIALGFGLFAILSIIRLRSSTVTQQEVAYYFVALVLGLVNGLNLDNLTLVLAVNVLLLAAMALVDSRLLRDRSRRLDITLDTVHADEASLVADLERRLGGKVVHHQVNEVDWSRDTMLVDVRYRAGTATAAAPGPPERRTEVTLDSVHSGDAPLVADLERRLGGRVIHHEVKEMDYVRDTMVVDVRYHLGWPVHDQRFGPGPGAPRHGGPPAGSHYNGPHHSGPAPHGPHNPARP